MIEGFSEAWKEPTRQGRFAGIARALSMPVPPVKDLCGAVILTVSTTIRERVHEARATLPLEVYLCIASINGGRHLVEHPTAFKEGWALLGVGLSQPSVGWLFIAAGLLRAVALFNGQVEWRERASSVHLVMVGAILYMIASANVDSPVIPNAQMAIGSNVWILVAAEWAKVERKRREGARA